LLPTFARGKARELETKDSVAAVAAADGDIDGVLFDEPLARERRRLFARHTRESEHLHMGYLPDGMSAWLDRSMTESIVRDPVDSFLGRVLACWWSKREGHERLRDVVSVSYFWLGRDRATRDIQRIYEHAYTIYAHADFWIAADWPKLAFDEH